MYSSLRASIKQVFPPPPRQSLGELVAGEPVAGEATPVAGEPVAGGATQPMEGREQHADTYIVV